MNEQITPLNAVGNTVIVTFIYKSRFKDYD